MAGYERYKSLVKEAWQYYCQGDHAGMARSLEESLEYTPYLKAETISDWVTRFVDLSGKTSSEFEIDYFTELPEWNKLESTILPVVYPKDIKVKGELTKPLQTITYDDLSIRGWPALVENGKIRVMSIFDQFSRECFSPFANLIEPRPDNALALLARDKPELLFVESAWHGNNSTWQYRIGKYANPPGTELISLVSECKRRKVPNVFWNKEDPVHFEKFIDTAQNFDYIFTTAEESIPLYRQRATQAKVNVLIFAAEAGLHNPIGSTSRNNKICFAGSFYKNRFSERQKDQLMLLDAASYFDLDIYDRNADNLSKDFCFPERFNRFIRGKLSYHEMNKAYRQYKVFLNVNSVIDSKTMFSRRVFELLACGTPVVSTISKGIEEIFGQDLVWTVKNEVEAKEAISTLLNNPIEWRRRSIQGIRAVFRQHTFAHRFQSVSETTGLSTFSIEKKRVLIVAQVESQNEVNSLTEMQSRQILHDVYSKMILFTTEENLVVKGSNVALCENCELTVSIVQDNAKKRQASHIALLDPKAIYGAYYLQDLLYAFDYSKADIVGKPLSGEDTYAYVDNIAQGSMVICANFLCQNENLENSLLNEISCINKANKQGKFIFAPDAANYLKYPQSFGILSIDEL
ncbi:CgeB family protein [Limnospira platensis CENA597]|uniref:CgeB family protein n=1 Tax=Limnospira platensis TaxID=118562 RepID=UPI003D9FB7AB